MLYQQDGDPSVSDPCDQASQIVDLGTVHPGGGFIEKHKPRLAGERARNLNTTLIAEGELQRLYVPLHGDADKVEKLPRFLGGCPLAARYSKQRRRIAHDSPIDRSVTADHDVLEDGQAANQTNVLEIPGDPHLQHTIRASARVVVAVESDTTAGRSKSAADNIEKRGLPGAVGTDQGMNMPRGDVAGNIVQSQVSTEAAAHTSGAEKSAHALRDRSVGSKPPGRQIAITTNSVPNTVMRQSCTARSISGTSVTIAAPTMGPNGFPAPPRTT